MNEKRYRRHEKYMLGCKGDGAQDNGHVRRVLYAALTLAASEKNVDLDVLVTAALLHDVGREEQMRTGENYAHAGARKVQAYLIEAGEGEAFARRVADCVRTHRFRADDPPVSVEAKLLYDADKLENTGAVGVARALMRQGYAGHPLYCVDDNGVVMNGEEKTASFYSEYRHRLRGAAGRFLTETGKGMALRRAHTAEQYNGNLRAEVAAGESGSGWRLLPREATARQRRVFNLSLMLAGETEKIDRGELARLIMEAGDADRSIPNRAVADAVALEDVGALGVANRLMAMGKAREPLHALAEEDWREPEFYSPQAKGIAAVRVPVARDFVDALRRETEECREKGAAALEALLKK